jgi:putative NIF3 family GTP cyclohydrolase 1 type 2
LNLTEFYRFVTEEGISQDPRGVERVKLEIKRKKEEFEKLEGAKKREFDQETLRNPYSDTRILNDTKKEIKNILVGIDIETPELLLADRLKSRGKEIDLVLAHHPEGRAYANFYEVMDMQADILNKYGVPINIAEDLLEKRIKEVSRKVMPVNHFRAADAARLLDISFICVHTPADNFVATYLQRLMDEKKPERVEDAIELLKEIPEYKEATITGSGPKVIVGSEKRRAGKIFVDMTGGTEGSVEALEKLSLSGIGTIVGMHMSEKHCENAEKFHINVIIAGHIASDTLGLNLLLDRAIEKFGPFNMISCSGFYRVQR